MVEATKEEEDGAKKSGVIVNVEATEVNAEDGTTRLKRRKLTSDVWLEIEKIRSPHGLDFAICKHCKKLTGSSANGTSHLRKHLERCPLRAYRPSDQGILQMIEEANEETATLKNFKFDKERSRFDIARMVIKHNYPFNMVEHDFFHIFVNNLQPSFSLNRRNTLRADILKIYKDEKERLYKLLDEFPSRISLTTDLWTCSPQKIAYCCLTAHYIDDNWVLRKKILAFPNVEGRHDADSLLEIMKGLLEWNIEKKIFSVTLDNATANDAMVRNLRTWLCEQKPLVLEGNLLHNRCATHVTNLIVQEGYQVVKDLIQKIKDSVSYVNASPLRKQQFANALSQVKLQNQKLPGYDVPNKWNSTYLMLENAIGVREAFSRLAKRDEHFTSNPSKEDWETGKVVCTCLKVFYEATCKFSGVKYPTSNLYFPIVCGIQKALMGWEEDEKKFVQNIAYSMKEKFEKYWSDCSLVMSLGVILDPRYKLDMVEYFFNELYGISAEVHLVKIRTALASIFCEYGGGSCNSSSSSLTKNVSPSTKSCAYDVNALGGFKQGFQEWYEKNRAVNIKASKKSELDRYLEETIVLHEEFEDFDILNWWRDNSPRFPTLEKIARDVLAIPASTVASESAFSIGGNIIEPSHHALGGYCAGSNVWTRLA